MTKQYFQVSDHVAALAPDAVVEAKAIAEATGVTLPTVRKHLARLISNGAIVRTEAGLRTRGDTNTL